MEPHSLQNCNGKLIIFGYSPLESSKLGSGTEWQAPHPLDYSTICKAPRQQLLVLGSHCSAALQVCYLVDPAAGLYAARLRVVKLAKVLFTVTCRYTINLHLTKYKCLSLSLIFRLICSKWTRFDSPWPIDWCILFPAANDVHQVPTLSTLDHPPLKLYRFIIFGISKNSYTS